jgi:hypothetical protein
LNSNGQRVREAGARGSAVPANDDGIIPRSYCSIPDGPPDLLNQRLGQGLSDDTSDIVCLENFGWDFHEVCIVKGSTGRISVVVPGVNTPATSSGSNGSASGVAKAARVAVTLFEFLYHFEANLLYTKKHQLRDPLAWINRERGIAAVPAGDLNFPLVVAVDESNQVAQHDTVLMTEA